MLPITQELYIIIIKPMFTFIKMNSVNIFVIFYQGESTSTEVGLKAVKALDYIDDNPRKIL